MLFIKLRTRFNYSKCHYRNVQSLTLLWVHVCVFINHVSLEILTHTMYVNVIINKTESIPIIFYINIEYAGERERDRNSNRFIRYFIMG